MIRKSAYLMTKPLLKREEISRKKNLALLKVIRVAKRQSKRTLRNVLLSKVFNLSFKVIFCIVVTGIGVYGAYAFMEIAFGNNIVVSKSEILSRIEKHTPLPAGEPQDIVRVQDENTLKTQNVLFKDVQEGYYIIVYPSLAIVYDLRNDAIVAMKRTDNR